MHERKPEGSIGIIMLQIIIVTKEVGKSVQNHYRSN